MRLQSLLKTALTSTFSFALLSCAGKPPAIEHPIKLYRGIPSQQAMCRESGAVLSEYAHNVFTHAHTKRYIKAAIEEYVAPDAQECIPAASPDFAGLAGLSFEDLGVIMRYIENLIYKCDKWKN